MSRQLTHSDVGEFSYQIDPQVRKFLRQIARQYTQIETSTSAWLNFFQLFSPWKIQTPGRNFCISPTSWWLLHFWEGTQSACDDLDDFNELHVTGWQADISIYVEILNNKLVFTVTFQNMNGYDYQSEPFDSFEDLKSGFPALLPYLKFADKEKPS